MNLHPVDARIAAEMLNLAADEFSNHGCNDYEVPNTPETIALIHRMNAVDGEPDEELYLRPDARLYLMDTQVMRYCARVLAAWADGQK